MNAKQKKILNKEREKHPAEVAFIELFDALGVYDKKEEK